MSNFFTAESFEIEEQLLEVARFQDQLLEELGLKNNPNYQFPMSAEDIILLAISKKGTTNSFLFALEVFLRSNQVSFKNF